MAEKLFGTLHTPLKPLNYSEHDTDTIDITIDNKTRSISAELSDKILNTINNSRIQIENLKRTVTNISNELDALKDELNTVLESDLSKFALKSDIPVDVSKLNNDAGYVTKEYVDSAIGDVDLSNVDKAISDLSDSVTSLEEKIIILESVEFIEASIDE